MTSVTDSEHTTVTDSNVLLQVLLIMNSTLQLLIVIYYYKCY